MSVTVAFTVFLCCEVSAFALMLGKGPNTCRRTRGSSGARSLVARNFLSGAGRSGSPRNPGGALGACLSVLALQALRGLSPGGMGRIAFTNGPLLATTVLFSVVTTLFTGMYPAWARCTSVSSYAVEGRLSGFWQRGRQAIRYLTGELMEIVPDPLVFEAEQARCSRDRHPNCFDDDDDQQYREHRRLARCIFHATNRNERSQSVCHRLALYKGRRDPGDAGNGYSQRAVGTRGWWILCPRTLIQSAATV